MSGLYIHVPFQRTARPHDDAYTVAWSESAAQQYLGAARAEIERYGRMLTDAAVETLYVGGGRPSLLATDSLRRLFQQLRRHVDVSALREVTLELHPLDATPAFLSALREMGVTRLSLDARALTPASLTAVGASFGCDDVCQSLEALHTSAIDSFSVDLIFGAPQHAPGDWPVTLARAVESGCPHITVIEWTDSSGTPVGDSEEAADLFRDATTFLTGHGFEAYELTHFARPGHRSRHESDLLAHKSYLGIGPSAHSFWWPSPRAHAEAHRWRNVADLDAYTARLDRGERPTASTESCASVDLAKEYIYLRLRTAEGLDPTVLDTRYGAERSEAFVARIVRLMDEGLLERHTRDCLRLTLDGRLQTDSIVAFLTAAL